MCGRDLSREECDKMLQLAEEMLKALTAIKNSASSYDREPISM